MLIRDIITSISGKFSNHEFSTVALGSMMLKNSYSCSRPGPKTSGKSIRICIIFSRIEAHCTRNSNQRRLCICGRLKCLIAVRRMRFLFVTPIKTISCVTSIIISLIREMAFLCIVTKHAYIGEISSTRCTNIREDGRGRQKRARKSPTFIFTFFFLHNVYHLYTTHTYETRWPNT